MRKNHYFRTNQQLRISKEHKGHGCIEDRTDYHSNSHPRISGLNPWNLQILPDKERILTWRDDPGLPRGPEI